MRKHHRIKIQKKTEDVYKKYEDKLYYWGNKYETVKKSWKILANSPDLSKEKRKKYQTMLDSGMADQFDWLMDEKIAKKIDKELGEAIEEMIKNKELPPREKTYKAKAKQHVKRNINEEQIKGLQHRKTGERGEE